MNGFLNTLVGIFIGALVVHLLNKDRDIQIKEIIRRDSARKSLEKAFMETLILLEVKPPVNPAIGNEWQKTWKLLERFYRQHRIAVWKFEYSLPFAKRARFREAWNQYCCYDTDNNCEDFSFYKSESMEEEFGKRQFAISRIKNLLNYAK